MKVKGRKAGAHASSDAFLDFVIDQLSAIPDVRPKSMFGGIGLYAGDTFFALLSRDVLYLKVDDSNRARYERAGSAAFRPYADKPMTMSYYNVPVGVLEDPDELVAWARLSIALGRQVKGPTAATPRVPAVKRRAVR